MTSRFSEMTPSSIFSDFALFSYWSKIHANIITSSGVITISFYKGLTRNSEIGNTPVWVLPNIWRLGQSLNTKFDTNISNKTLLNAANYQGFSFCHFWVIKGKPTRVGGGGGVKFPPTHTPRLALRELFVLIFTDNVIHCHTFTLSEHWLDSIVFYLISDFYYTYLKTLINNKTIIFGALSPKFRKGS